MYWRGGGCAGPERVDIPRDLVESLMLASRALCAIVDCRRDSADSLPCIDSLSDLLPSGLATNRISSTQVTSESACRGFKAVAGKKSA